MIQQKIENLTKSYDEKSEVVINGSAWQRGHWILEWAGKESIWESGLPFQTANVKESQSNGEGRKNKKPKEKPGKEKGDWKTE